MVYGILYDRYMRFDMVGGEQGLDTPTWRPNPAMFHVEHGLSVRLMVVDNRGTAEAGVGALVSC